LLTEKEVYQLSGFTELVSKYLEMEWQADPVMASTQGVHKYDAFLPDASPEAADSLRGARKNILARFKALQDTALTEAESFDRDVVISELETLLKADELDLMRRAAFNYSEIACRALNILFERDYAPLEERMESLLERLRGLPAYIAQGQRNVTPECPPLWVDIALAGCAGGLTYLSDALPRIAARVPSMEEEILKEARKVASALEEYAAFLRELKPKARGHFGIGKDHLDFLLKVQHGLDMDSSDLEAFGRDQVAAYTRKLEELAKRVDPSKNWVQLVEEAKDRFPPPAELLAYYQKEIDDCREFVIERDLVTIPPGETCVMAPTPVFLLSRYPMGYFNSVRPFEDGENRGMWYMTPVDLTRPESEQVSHMRDHNYGFMRSITLHETYPGHHLQLYTQKLNPSLVRRRAHNTVYIEGWGLYTEELMWEEGYLNDTDARLIQLKNGLWRAVRILIDVGLHTRTMTFEEAVRLLVDHVRFEPGWAAGEIRRYTTSPTQPSSYLVGKDEILKLRAKCAEMMGDRFTLKGFHDKFLSYGGVPLPMVARDMLKGGR
jgi:uncharacterized protein (DUF885 family)